MKIMFYFGLFESVQGIWALKIHLQKFDDRHPLKNLQKRNTFNACLFFCGEILEAASLVYI